MENIVYVVTLKSECAKYMELTTVDKAFYAKMIKQDYGNIYFELNGSKVTVIIPEEWIHSMAPAKPKPKKKYLLCYQDKIIDMVDHSLYTSNWHTVEVK